LYISQINVHVVRIGSIHGTQRTNLNLKHDLVIRNQMLVSWQLVQTL